MNALLAAAMLLLAGQEPTAGEAAEKVRLDIQVIHATHGQPFVDPTLRPIGHYLEKSFGSRYQAFHQLSSRSFVLGEGRTGTERLPNDAELTLTYLGIEDGLLRLAMEVGGLKTTVKIHDGGLFFQAGRSWRDGMIVVAIRASRLG